MLSYSGMGVGVGMGVSVGVGIGHGGRYVSRYASRRERGGGYCPFCSPPPTQSVTVTGPSIAFAHAPCSDS